MQKKIRMTLQALQLVPVKPEGNSAHLPIEVRSLFLLPSTSQPIIHVIPAASKTMHKTHTKEYVVGQSVSLSSYLQKVNTEDPPETCLYHECGNKLLKNFVTIWVKAAINRHPMHSNYNSGRKGDISKPAPLPSAMQFISAVVPLLAFLFNKPITENGADFKKIITSEYPSTKGMIQQIDVILRKKIRDSIEVERVFSKSHSMDVLQKCVDTYLQDSPPYYTQQYHKWKVQNKLLHIHVFVYRYIEGLTLSSISNKMFCEFIGHLLADPVWKNAHCDLNGSVNLYGNTRGRVASKLV